MTKGKRTYQPDNSLKGGYFSLFGEILAELSENRWLMFQLFKREFFATYKQSFFGVFWAVLLPFVSVGTFIVLNRSGLFFLGDLTVPYPLYAILGMAFWQVFATGVVGGSHSLVNAGSMLTQINFSRKSLVVASVAQSLVSFLVQFLLVVALLVYYGLPPSPAIFAVPVFLIPLLALTLGLALLLSLLNGIFRDIMNVLSIFITFLMFLTPVLYAQTHTGILGEITRYNPLHYLISGAREMVLSGSVSDPLGYSLTSALSLVFLWISLLAFHLTESRIAERA